MINPDPDQVGQSGLDHLTELIESGQMDIVLGERTPGQTVLVVADEMHSLKSDPDLLNKIVRQARRA